MGADVADMGEMVGERHEHFLVQPIGLRDGLTVRTEFQIAEPF